MPGTCKSGNWNIPYPVESDQDLRTLGKTEADVRISRCGSKKRRIVWIENDDPGVYQETMRTLWADEKKESRGGRCLIPDQHGGFIRCSGNCRDCQRTRNGLPDSLDLQNELTGFDPADDRDEIEAATLLMTLKDLLDEVRSLDPQSARILELILDERSERDIAGILGIGKSTAHERSADARALLKSLYGR